MKYKLILGIVLFVLMSSFVAATITVPNGYAYWEFDNNGVDEFNGGSNSMPGVTYSTNTIVGTHSLNYIAAPVINSSIFSDMSEIITNVSTISFWVNMTSGTGDEVTFAITDGGANNDGFILWRDGAGNLEVRFYVDASLKWQYDLSVANVGEWYMWTIVQEGSLLQFYIDDRIESNQSTTFFMDDGFDKLSFGGGVSGFLNGKGMIDNLVFDKDAWTTAEVKTAYNLGNGDTFAQSTTGVSITSTLPANNTQFSTTLLNLNATIVPADVPYNCSLYINEIVNQTQNNIANTTTEVLFNVTFGATEESTNNYTFSCVDSYVAVNSTTNSFYIDNANPAITTSFTNNQYIFSNNLSGQFNFTDGFLLYSYNISIDGVTLSNQTVLNTTFFSYNLSYDTSSLVAGTHNLSIEIADGHTAHEIPNYAVSDGLFNNKLRYEMPHRQFIQVEQKGGSIFDRFSTTKKKDRYSFDFTPNQGNKQTYSFTVTSDEPFTIIETDSAYKNYLISGKQWIDFVSPGNPNSDVDIVLINPYEAEVTVRNLNPSNKFSFNSIGELNTVTTSYTFFTITSNSTYVSEVIESQVHATNINFNITGTGLTDDNISASLLYNNTPYTVSKVSDGSTYVNFLASPIAPVIEFNSTQKTFNWSVNISSNPTESATYNNTVYKINIGDCDNVNVSAGWTESLNFLSVDEEQNNATAFINTTLNIDLKVWFADEDVFRNFSFGFENDYNYSICIFPNSSSYKIYSTMEYFSPGYANRKYYLDNYTLDNTTDSIYLYNLNSSKASDIVFTVVDRNTGEKVPNAFIKILRYYPETSETKVVEVEKTDDNGLALGKMVIADVFYQFIVETNRTVRITTAVQRMLSLTKTLNIVQEEDALESWNRIGDVASTVTCTNSTQTCRMTWSDSTNLVQTAVLKVFRYNGFGKTEISSTTSSAAAGTLTYTITENTTGNQYNAIGYIHTNTENSFYDIGTAFLDYRQGMSEKFGLSALFPIMLLLIALGTAFIDSGAVPVVAVSLIGLVFLVMIGLVPLSITTVVSFIIIGAIMIGKLRA